MSLPPRSIDELLQELTSADPGRHLEPDEVIRGHFWANGFREFLEKRKMRAKVAALKFLVLTQSFDEGEKESLAIYAFVPNFLSIVMS